VCVGGVVEEEVVGGDVEDFGEPDDDVGAGGGAAVFVAADLAASPPTNFPVTGSTVPSRLVHDYQDWTPLGEVTENLAELGLGLWQRLVIDPCTGRVQGAGVVLFLADIQADVDGVLRSVHTCLPLLVVLVAESGEGCRHPRYEETYPEGRPCPYQRSTHATRTGDNTPRIMRKTGAESHVGPGDQNPASRGHEEGNGSATGRTRNRRPRVRLTCWIGRSAMGKRGVHVPQRIPGDPKDPHGFPVLVEEFLTDLAARGYSPVTIRARRQCLAALSAWLADRGVTQPVQVPGRFTPPTTTPSGTSPHRSRSYPKRSPAPPTAPTPDADRTSPRATYSRSCPHIWHREARSVASATKPPPRVESLIVV
jgi:hypothetical protein